MIEAMDIPITRSQFERRFFLLNEMLEYGRIHFRSRVTIESLKVIRRLPNGRIDFLSVDEFARLQANMVASMLSGTPEVEEDVRASGCTDQEVP